jgi:FlaA1/EpsC-like NDP-sugar epimerase
MFDSDTFISDYITHRKESLFMEDMHMHRESLQKEIQGKRVLVIGGAGTIGASFIKALLPFEPAQLTVVDISENGLNEPRYFLDH